MQACVNVLVVKAEVLSQIPALRTCVTLSLKPGYHNLEISRCGQVD